MGADQSATKAWIKADKMKNNNLYAGTNNGIYPSTDNALTWTLISASREFSVLLIVFLKQVYQPKQR